jgi:hypothetical protein
MWSLRRKESADESRILGNLYSRLGGGSAFPSMVVGILLEVPNAIAAAGGLSGGEDNDESQINNAVLVR